MSNNAVAKLSSHSRAFIVLAGAAAIIGRSRRMTIRFDRSKFRAESNAEISDGG
jgi:hypothetical protein